MHLKIPCDPLFFFLTLKAESCHGFVNTPIARGDLLTHSNPFLSLSHEKTEFLTGNWAGLVERQKLVQKLLLLSMRQVLNAHKDI